MRFFLNANLALPQLRRVPMRWKRDTAREGVDKDDFTARAPFPPAFSERFTLLERAER